MHSQLDHDNLKHSNYRFQDFAKSSHESPPHQPANCKSNRESIRKSVEYEADKLAKKIMQRVKSDCRSPIDSCKKDSVFSSQSRISQYKFTQQSPIYVQDGQTQFSKPIKASESYHIAYHAARKNKQSIPEITQNFFNGNMLQQQHSTKKASIQNKSQPILKNHNEQKSTKKSNYYQKFQKKDEPKEVETFKPVNREYHSQSQKQMTSNEKVTELLQKITELTSIVDKNPKVLNGESNNFFKTLKEAQELKEKIQREYLNQSYQQFYSFNQ